MDSLTKVRRPVTTGRTTLIVAHRFSTIRHAHRIVVLHGGKIVELGMHAELLARGGHFFRLAQLQSVTTSAPAAAWNSF
jgi:ABC-type multidrug transport system fused ATPase/permease subunit